LATTTGQANQDSYSAKDVAAQLPVRSRIVQQVEDQVSVVPGLSLEWQKLAADTVVDGRRNPFDLGRARRHAERGRFREDVAEWFPPGR
jgi:hypothetical protein